MDFKQATDELTRGVTLSDVAEEAGVSDALIRRARLDPDSSSYRRPPASWRDVIARIAETRSRELADLAASLRADPETGP
jgi:hypothetical protein